MDVFSVVASKAKQSRFPGKTRKYMQGDVKACSSPGELQGKAPKVSPGWGTSLVVAVVDYNRFE